MEKQDRVTCVLPGSLRVSQRGSSDIAHVPPRFLPSHKLRTAHAMYAMAMEVERQLFGATADATPSAGGGGAAPVRRPARAAGGGDRGAVPPAAPTPITVASASAPATEDAATIPRELG